MLTGPVLVVGLGPAGASTAIFLAQLGLDVVAVDRKLKTGLKIGECLPPDAKTLLDQLGVWAEFMVGGHEPYYANRAYWHSDKVQYHDFVQHPIGHGWHIDRPGFEAMLRAKAQDLGVVMHEQTNIHALEFDGNLWNVTWMREGQCHETLAFSFIVDATGRSSWVARRQGVARLLEDRQRALVAFLQADTPLQDSTTLVETVDHGWWYSARSPGNRLATAFLFQPHRTHPTVSRTEADWWTFVGQAQHTARRLAAGEVELLAPPALVAADSGILETIYGNGWLAVGDAAMTYDPIASHGLMMSMVSARDAAIAIKAYLNGVTGPLDQYGHRMYSAFRAYAEIRKRYYPAGRHAGSLSSP